MIKIRTTEIGQVKLGETNVPFVKNGNKFVFPYDAEIEYLESSSDGGEYINTGINGSNNISIKLECIYKKNSNEENLGFIFGSRVAAARQDYSVIHSYAGQFRYGNVITQNTFIVNQDTFVLFDNTESHNIMKIYDNEGVLLSTLTVAANTFSNNMNIYLFSVNNNGEVGNSCRNLKIFDCKIYNDSTLVRDFVPVRVGNVGYMYDKVSGKLFGNAGTGDFILGPDKI